MLKLFLISFLAVIAVAPQVKGQELSITNEMLIGKSIHLKKEYNYLLPEVTSAFNQMKSAAKKDGIEIQLVSGYRNFNRQKAIFLSKYKRYRNQGLSQDATLNKIIEYSTIPGTSRHHWGTDIDLIQKVKNTPKNLLVAKNYENEGPFCEMKEWLDSNASKYGFQLVYTNDSNRTGFKYEPWHFTYAPISITLLKHFLKYNSGNKIYPIIKNEGIPVDKSFFDNYIQTHIKGIHPTLLTN